MHILNKLFDKIFLITTSKITSRHDYVKKLIYDYNLKVNLVFAPHRKYCNSFNNLDLWGGKRDDNSAYMSLTSSYYSIFSEMLFFDYPKILIIEDDFEFNEGYKMKLENFMNSIPSSWDYLNLGYHESKELEHGWKVRYKNEFSSEIDVSWTTHAVAFQNKSGFINRLIDRMNDCDNSIEHILNYFTHIDRKISAYTPNDIIFKQISDKKDGFKSLIRN